jgi:drug/metabolite transporter (DMT)-like permease
MISELGIAATFIFSFGALILSSCYYIYCAVNCKKETGFYWKVQRSNLFMECNETGMTIFNFKNFRGLIIRTCFNIGFQMSIMMGFMNAIKAGLNPGMVTCLLSTYCVFVSILSILIFKEQLKPKFIVGILLMLACVAFVAANKDNSIDNDVEEINDRSKYFYKTIGYGLLAPVMISLFITFSKYWTHVYGYES